MSQPLKDLGTSDLSGPMGLDHCTSQNTGHHQERALGKDDEGHFYLFVFDVFDFGQ